MRDKSYLSKPGMKTQQYNPSPLEQELANAIANLQSELSQRLSGEIIEVKSTLKADNPKLDIRLRDSDGDEHQLVVQIIQRIDEEISSSSGQQ